MEPKTVRMILRGVSLILAIATFVVGKWELGAIVDSESFMSALLAGVMASLSTGALALSAKAPGDERRR